MNPQTFKDLSRVKPRVCHYCKKEFLPLPNEPRNKYKNRNHCGAERCISLHNQKRSRVHDKLKILKEWPVDPNDPFPFARGNYEGPN
jgi:hypothetical protein